MNGVVYIAGPDDADPEATVDGNLTLRGALVGDADLDLRGAGTATLIYDPEVVTRLRRTHGSFVRVPGSWKDF